ncbi:MAG TPA: PTS sugar transporter subunit IIA [Clostridia bacterium]|nr:PTS sugar transporter subunit IIA [Clostridia bacterium]
MRISSYTSSNLIIPQLRSRSTPAVVGELCSLLHRENRLGDPLSFYNAVMSQEAICSTATSSGWALPYATVRGNAHLCFALGRSTTPLDWTQPSGAAVRFVSLFLVPEGETATHKALLSELEILSQDQFFIENLSQAANCLEIMNVLRKFQLDQKQYLMLQT